MDGRRSSHIPSPRTGMPVRGLAGVSVAAPECVVAGSATTIAMLMEDRGAQWLDEVGLPHVGMDQQRRVGGADAWPGSAATWAAPRTGSSPSPTTAANRGA